MKRKASSEHAKTSISPQNILLKTANNSSLYSTHPIPPIQNLPFPHSKIHQSNPKPANPTAPFDPLLDFGNDQPMDWEGVDLGMGPDSDHRGGLHSSGPANQRQWSSGQPNNSGGRLKKGWFLPENLGFKEDLFKDLDDQIFKEAFVANQNVRDEMKRMRRSLINRFQANHRNRYYYYYYSYHKNQIY